MTQQLYLYNTLLTTSHVGLITIFACFTLPEHYSDFCVGVQHSVLIYSEIPIVILNVLNFYHQNDQHDPYNIIIKK